MNDSIKCGKCKVLLINGSPRKNGNTFVALSEAARTLEQHGIKTEIVQIGVKPVRGCIACAQCKTRQLGRCVFDDDICNRISEKMAQADGLIVGSPVYYGQPNGAVMSLIQRMFYSAGALFTNKPAASVCVCRRGGATAAFQTMNMPFEMMNMPLVTSQYWNIVYGREEGQAALDTEGMQTMRTLANNMAWLLRKIHADGNPDYPEREEWNPMHFIR
ncbi:MAG: flavodoxin family protein [Bacteroidaceae bacterium]|nr:flavodoxin family protein [Bacteroidaceae bacterium]